MLDDGRVCWNPVSSSKLFFSNLAPNTLTKRKVSQRCQLPSLISPRLFFIYAPLFPSLTPSFWESDLCTCSPTKMMSFFEFLQCLFPYPSSLPHPSVSPAFSLSPGSEWGVSVLLSRPDAPPGLSFPSLLRFRVCISCGQASRTSQLCVECLHIENKQTKID